MGSADLVADYAVPVPVAVIHELLGIPEVERMPTEEFVHLFYQLAFVEPRSGPASERLHAYADGLLAYKRAHPGDGITTALIAELEQGNLRHEIELHALMMSLLGAGHATTVPFLGAAIL